MPGMYAVVTFTQADAGGGGSGSSLVVSADAIAIRKDQPTAAVIADNKVKLTPVILGRDYGPEIEILSGLHQGDLVAATFTDAIVDGAKVRTRINNTEQEKARQPAPGDKPTPPGGSTQYGDPGIIDQNMQGQTAQQKQKKGGDKKAKGSKGSKP